MLLAFGGYVVLFGGKLAVYYLTGIGVMFAEALHSLADMLISGFLLAAFFWSRRPADEDYRFGYGRAQNIAALVASTIFISFTSLEVFREAIPKFFQPLRTDYGHINLAIFVMLAAMIISGFPLLKIWFGRERGAASRAQMIESINDLIALVAALIGIVFIGRGIPLADPIASVVVGVIIAINAGLLWVENARNLMGRSPDVAFYKKVEEIARSVPGVVAVHDLDAEMMGDGVHVGLHIEVAKGTPIEEVDDIAEQLDSRIEQEFENTNCIIHIDPAR